MDLCGFFYSRKDGDKNPLWFTLGMREVLPGWDKGLQDMCTGERRKLTIPPALAYGKEGKGVFFFFRLNLQKMTSCEKARALGFK